MKKSLLAIVILILIFLIWWQPLNFGKTEVTIPKGANGKTIADYLAKHHIVRDVNEFLFCLKMSGKEKYLRPGIYELEKYKNPIYLINKLLHGGKSDIAVVIPEGLSVYETAEILATKALIDPEQFIILCGDKNFIHEIGLNVPSLEGYLFPDTYSFSTSQSDTDIIRIFIANFYDHIKKFNLENPDSMKKIIILASIVEKEAKYTDEKPVIANVFINRLKLHRPLESCATVFYALRNEHRSSDLSRELQKTRLTERDLEFNSPYNTYLHIGLPPGPICSPGENSIQAVILPSHVNYLYFVAKGDGRHYFSKTYQEHLFAKTRYHEAK